MSEKSNPQMDASRMFEAVQARNAWVVTVEAAITRQQLTHPDFFAHVAAKLRPYDRIEVRCDDGTYFAELLVLEAARTYARTHVLSWANLTTQDVAQSQAAPSVDPLKDYEVVHKGPHLKWVVVRKSDGERIREHEETKVLARAWLDEYVRITATA